MYFVSRNDVDVIYCFRSGKKSKKRRKIHSRSPPLSPSPHGKRKNRRRSRDQCSGMTSQPKTTAANSSRHRSGSSGSSRSNLSNSVHNKHSTSSTNYHSSNKQSCAKHKPSHSEISDHNASNPRYQYSTNSKSSRR